jgi:predicted small secreted protein
VRRRALPAITAAVLLASLVLAGCGSKDGADEPSDSGPDAQNVAAAAQIKATWPLTGLPVTGDDEAAQTHPVMVLKMDNTYASAPQKGLGSADMVVEELVEGGMTRLAAFYYSKLPGDVGPVRSMRASDIGIVSPVKATVVTSGAAQVTINRIDHAGIHWYTEGDKGFYRDSSRHAPYNLFTKMSETATLVHQADAERPADYLPWGDEKDFPKGQPARTLAASFSGGHTTNWTFHNGTYVNENTYAGAGDEFPADTVLVLRVKVGDAGYRDPAGNPVPETQFTGKGQAMIFHDGRLVRGQWSKDSLGSPLALSTTAGDLTVPAGHTWIELVPQDGGSVTVGK